MKRYKTMEEIALDIAYLKSQIDEFHAKSRIIEDTCSYKHVSNDFAYWCLRAICDRELEDAIRSVKCKEAVPKEEKDADVEKRAYMTVEFLTNYKDNEFVPPVMKTAKVQDAQK